MKCPVCDGPDTRIRETRQARGRTLRRRVCIACDASFYTTESLLVGPPAEFREDRKTEPKQAQKQVKQQLPTAGAELASIWRV